jgi:hypothetical protein
MNFNNKCYKIEEKVIKILDQLKLKKIHNKPNNKLPKI